MKQTTDSKLYGTLDASFQAAGGEKGVLQLVNDFYDYMESLKSAEGILKMHPTNLALSRDKLFSFLCGWLGGPRLYREKYGPISIPSAHAHLKIGNIEKTAWLTCMQKAIDMQDYHPSFKVYLFEQLSVPAERVRNCD